MGSSASGAGRRTAATRSIPDLFRLFARKAPERPPAPLAPQPRPDEAPVAKGEGSTDVAPERADDDVATAFAALQAELHGLLAVVEKAPASEAKH
jgi:hypothetical protein